MVEATEQKVGRTPELAEFDFKLKRDINNMPLDVRDRFKAIKVIYDQCNDNDLELQELSRALEVKYEKLYKEVYQKRAALLSGSAELDQALIDEFDKRRDILKDFEDVDVDVCDVKDIQNSASGVPGFWLRAICGHQELRSKVSEKDRPILQYLQNVTLDLDDKGFGFKLTFTFEKNSYFSETVLIKTFKLKNAQQVEKAIGTPITWSPGSDVTKTTKKKGKGKKKTSVVVQANSFFNFFQTHDSAQAQEPGKKVMLNGEEVEEENPEAEALQSDFAMGKTMSEELVPLALEQYLGVLSDDDSGENDDSGEDLGEEEFFKKPNKNKK